MERLQSSSSVGDEPGRFSVQERKRKQQAKMFSKTKISKMKIVLLDEEELEEPELVVLAW